VFLAALFLGVGAQSHVLRCYREVYDLALYKGKVAAATSGGALVEKNRRWVGLGLNSPAPLRKLFVEGSTLDAVDRAGMTYELRQPGETWVSTGRLTGAAASALPSPTVSFQGRNLVGNWGSRYLRDAAGAPVIPRDPADGDYALLADKDRLLAGTPTGIYEWNGSRWSRDELPAGLPVLRPQGIGFSGGQTIVAGLEGVYVRRRTEWAHPSKEPVRQLLATTSGVFVLYGSGAVDKFDLIHNQIVYDAVNEGAKRPWTSCLAAFEKTVVFGGQGGWIERTPKGIAEHYLKEIDNDVVMAVAGRGTERWIGTQKTGLLRFNGGSIKSWNPGNGLTDTWVTALLHTRDGLYVATSTDGLYLLKGDTIQPIASPTRRPRSLAQYKGKVVVGGMDGAWIHDASGWRTLPTGSEETTSIVAGSKLVITTAAGVYFL